MLVRLTAIAVCALLMLAAACGTPEYFHDPEHLWKAHVLASSLRSAYLDNPVRFEQEHRDDSVLAYGKVRRIRTDGQVEFHEGIFRLFGNLVCSFKNQRAVAKLEPGDEIKVTGSMPSIDGWYVHLTDCEITE